MRDLVIIGAGGFGREVVGLVDAINAGPNGPVWNLVGIADDDPSTENLDRLDAVGLHHLGSVDVLLGDLSEAQFVIAVAEPRVRRAIAERLGADGRAATLIDPTARIGRGVRIEAGCVVAAHAQVTTNVSLGKHVHVDRSVQVGHDTTLADFVTLHPASVVSGGCRIGPESRVGTAATVLPGITIADDVLVGAAACVTRDFGPGQTVKGVPAT